MPTAGVEKNRICGYVGRLRSLDTNLFSYAVNIWSIPWIGKRMLRFRTP